MIDQTAREQAQKQWNANPCGAVEGGRDRLEYFLDVEQERYKIQYWQLGFFPFAAFRGRKVLEIGVGHGTDLVQFAKAGARCHGIDITDEHLALTEKNFALRGYDVELKKCDATAIAYPDNSFDAVYSFGVLHHIPEVEACISEIYRVLKPGGVALVGLYHKWSIHTLALLLYLLRRGLLFKLGYRRALSLIESGADGVEIAPYVRLYDRREVRRLFSSFTPVQVSVRQVYFTQLPLVTRVLRCLDSILGWYVLAVAYKPKAE